MRTFKEECDALAPLETFDPAAFKADEQTLQDLCTFVLALAVIYNDCKDAIYAHVLLQGSKPESPLNKSRIWGTYYGISGRISRLIVSHFHELFLLIRDHRNVLEHPVLVEVIRQLRPNVRDAWRALVAVALDATPADEFGRTLLLVRNKVVSHYDPKAIFRGYSQHFLESDRVDDRAYISRGHSVVLPLKFGQV